MLTYDRVKSKHRQVLYLTISSRASTESTIFYNSFILRVFTDWFMMVSTQCGVTVAVDRTLLSEHCIINKMMSMLYRNSEYNYLYNANNVIRMLYRSFYMVN